jgi:hypothetical protein
VLVPRHPLQCDGGDGGNMAKDETASTRSAKVARAYARYTINLQRAFNDPEHVGRTVEDFNWVLQ